VSIPVVRFAGLVGATAPQGCPASVDLVDRLGPCDEVLSDPASITPGALDTHWRASPRPNANRARLADPPCELDPSQVPISVPALLTARAAFMPLWASTPIVIKLPSFGGIVGRG
jgi:hypothetical protein